MVPINSVRLEWHSDDSRLPLTLHNRNAIKTRIRNRFEEERRKCEMHFWTQLVVDLMVYTSFYRYATPFFFFTLASTARSVGRFVPYFLLYFYMNIILWQNRSLGALGWTFSIFLFGIVSAVNQQFSLVSFSICAKIRKVLQMQTERQKSISNPRHANQINMFPFEMRAFCWCYCCLKAKAKSVQQSVVSLSGAGFRFYFFLRNG